MAYKPTQEDLTWTQDVIDRLADGGILAYPATGLIYKIDKQAKTFTLINPEMLIFFTSFVIHQCTKDTCKVLGYEVIGDGDV